MNALTQKLMQHKIAKIIVGNKCNREKINIGINN